MPDIIGQAVGNAIAASGTEAQCRRGIGQSFRGFHTVRGQVVDAMRAYVGLAGARVGADATPAFTKRAELRDWRRGLSPGTPTAVDDPLARAVAATGAALGEPAVFIWSFDRAAAHATWSLPDGHYRVLFRREARGWKLQRLEIIEAGEAPQVAPFCHKPGDVEANRAAYEASAAERARKREQREATRSSPAAQRRAAEVERKRLRQDSVLASLDRPPRRP